MKEYYEDLILKSFDSSLSKEEEEELKVALENDPELMKTYNQYLMIRESLSENSVGEFKNPFFEDSIIEKLKYEKNELSLFELLAVNYKKVLVPSLILTLILIVLNLSTFGNLINTENYTNDVSLADSYTTTIYMDLQNE